MWFIFSEFGSATLSESHSANLSDLPKSLKRNSNIPDNGSNLLTGKSFPEGVLESNQSSQTSASISLASKLEFLLSEDERDSDQLESFVKIHIDDPRLLEVISDVKDNDLKRILLTQYAMSCDDDSLINFFSLIDQNPKFKINSQVQSYELHLISRLALLNANATHAKREELINSIATDRYAKAFGDRFAAIYNYSKLSREELSSILANESKSRESFFLGFTHRSIIEFSNTYDLRENPLVYFSNFYNDNLKLIKTRETKLQMGVYFHSFGKSLKNDGTFSVTSETTNAIVNFVIDNDQYEMIDGFMEPWLRLNPKQASQWVDALPKSKLKNRGISNIVDYLRKNKDEASALEWSKQLSND